MECSITANDQGLQKYRNLKNKSSAHAQKFNRKLQPTGIRQPVFTASLLLCAVLSNVMWITLLEIVY